MAPHQAEILICGAGMAGVAVAYELAARRGRRGVVLVDEREPLSLTSSRGTEAYRTWWPGPDDAMVGLTSRSVERLDELATQCGAGFGMSRRGYAFLTADPARAAALERTAERAEALGAGPLRRNPPSEEAPAAEGDGPGDGADLITDPAAIRRRLPWAAADSLALLHVLRAGWLDAGRLGSWLLRHAEARGVAMVRDRMVAVDSRGGRVRSVRLAGGGRIATANLVLACGPGNQEAARLLGLDLPLVNRPHGKLVLDDVHGALPRDAPLVIWSDPVRLDWSDAERRRLAADRATAYLLGELPADVHARPRGEREVLVLWAYGGPAMAAGDGAARAPAWDRFPRFHPLFAEVVTRGLARAVPAFAAYRGTAAEHGSVDGGYYCKAPDNRPLIGPLPVAGAWIVGGLSGFGIMASPGAGVLLADHLTGGPLPSWAPAFLPGRFDDPGYRRKLAVWDPEEGEL